MNLMPQNNRCLFYRETAVNYDCKALNLCVCVTCFISINLNYSRFSIIARVIPGP